MLDIKSELEKNIREVVGDIVLEQPDSPTNTQEFKKLVEKLVLPIVNIADQIREGEIDDITLTTKIEGIGKACLPFFYEDLEDE